MSCSCLCPIHWSQVLVKNADVVIAVPKGDAPTPSEWSTILLPTSEVILEVWLYVIFHYDRSCFMKFCCISILKEIPRCSFFSTSPDMGPVLFFFFYLCNKVISRKCNISSHWLKSIPTIDRKWALTITTLHWCHNERDGVSNHRCVDGFLNHLFRCRSKKTSKLTVTGLCEGNPLVTSAFPHKGPVTRKMFPFDVIMVAFDMKHDISNHWLLQPWQRKMY